jgi:hypothetical protein
VGGFFSSLGSNWNTHPESQQILEHNAAADPDADVALQSLSLLRSVRLNDLGKLLDQRLQMAKSTGDSAGAEKLAKEQTSHYSWVADVVLPSFIEVPPPDFSVEPATKKIRVLAFGDFGTGSDAQKKLAAVRAT